MSTFTTIPRFVLALLVSGCVRAGAGKAPAVDSAASKRHDASALVAGKLSNGFSYYVIKNSDPSHWLFLRLVVRAGSAHERSDQRGSAHFVEHLAFDGTKGFTKNDTWGLFRELGMTFGADVNAETRLDSTQYRLAIPTDIPGALDKSLSLLGGIAGTISFDPAEIEQERRVLIEEARTRLVVDRRLENLEWATVLAGSAYARGLPFGAPEALASADRDTLLRFYGDWYRPDNMALVAVGDVDSAPLVRAIDHAFGALKAPTAAPPAALPEVATNQELLVKVVTDPELAATSLTLDLRVDNDWFSSAPELRKNLTVWLVASMLWNRLRYGRSAEATFLRIDESIAQPTFGLRMLRYKGRVTDSGLKAGVKALFGELASAARYGFSAQELFEAKQIINDRGLRADARLPSGDLANRLETDFLSGATYRDRAQWRLWLRNELPRITRDDVDAWAREHRQQGQTLLVSAPAGVAVPTEQEIRTWASEAALSPPSLPVDRKLIGPLLSQAPKPGSVVDTDQYTSLGVTSWQLSNGARVVVKPMNLSGGGIRIRGWLPGGTARYSDEDFVHGRFAAEIVRASGAGSHDARELRQALLASGSEVTLGEIQMWETLNIDTTSRGLEPSLDVAHLLLTEPRQSRDAFVEWQTRELESLHHRGAAPDTQFWDAVRQLTHEGDPRAVSLSAADVEHVDPQRALSVWREGHSNFNGATFIVVGSVELNRFRALVERYWAGLPSGALAQLPQAPPLQYPTGKVERTVRAGRAERSKVLLEFLAPDHFDIDLGTDLEIFQDVLQTRLIEVLRREHGDVYTPLVWAWWDRDPEVHHGLRILFECDPKNVEHLTHAVFDELRALTQTGIGDAYLEPVRLKVRRFYGSQRNNENWWLQTLERLYIRGDALSQINDANDALERVTVANVNATARRLFDENHYVLVVLRPE